PPNLKKDLPRLQAFLRHLPAGTRAAFEFRHSSWYEDDVFEALRDYDVALCVASTDEDEAPSVATAGYGYLRLPKEAYGADVLERWAEWIGQQAWSEAYVFFKHEDEGTGPKLARRFLDTVEG